MNVSERDEARAVRDEVARPLPAARPASDTPPQPGLPPVKQPREWYERPLFMPRENALTTAPREVIPPRAPFWSALIISALLLILVWLLVMASLGITPATGVLLMLPIVATGWLRGFRAALLVAVVSFVLNTAFLMLVMDAGWGDVIRAGGWLGFATVLLMSLGLGRLRDLGGRVGEHERQLRREHEALKAQVEEREWAETALRESEERYRLMVEGSEQVFFYTHDADHRFEYLSPSVAEVLGYHPEELIGQRYEILLTVDPMNEAVSQLTKNALQTGERTAAYVARVQHKSGRLIYLELIESPLRRGGKVIGLQGFARDITERIEAERLRQVLYEVAEAAHEAPDLVTLFRAVHRSLGRLLDVTNFCIALTENNRADLFTFPFEVDEDGEKDTSGRGPQLIPGSPTSYVVKTGRPLLADRQHYEELVAARAITTPGSPPVSWLGVPLEVGDKIIGVVVAQSRTASTVYTEKELEIMEFVSTQIAVAIERKRAQQALIESRESLRYLAHHDPLTMLPNRLLFYERLNHAIAQVRRYNRHMALLFVDLDNFKAVNDGYGHDVGDLVLQEVARRLQGCVREVDTVARIGGDEFTIILAEITHPADAGIVAQKILRVLASPYHAKDGELTITASIGGSIFHGGDKEMDDIIKHADNAMYRAKRTRNHYHQFGTTNDLTPPS
jgi:diguanylate cyclase (GGDEF)-like protein/PAS domain S-box-containing protein